MERPYSIQEIANIVTFYVQSLEQLHTYSERLKEAILTTGNQSEKGLLRGIGEYHSSNVLSMVFGIRLLPLVMRNATDAELEVIIKQVDNLAESYHAEVNEIDDLQIRLLKQIRPDHIYAEGKAGDHRAIRFYQTGLRLEEASFARGLGPTQMYKPTITYLDEGNPWYDQIAKSKSFADRLQQEREGIWANKIAETITSAKAPVIIAGSAHINNEFGLKEKLEGRDITLKQIVI